MQELVIALAGNPNAGKTTVFNALTGSRQHVGNYPGVTVEKKEGIVEKNGRRFRIVDLPGTYSLSAASPEEVVARRFLVQDGPDVVVQVVDASNLERNLYLATQLAELGVKLVLALNMADVAKERGYEFDIPALSRLFGVPVVPTVGNRGQGMDELLAAAAHAADSLPPSAHIIRYPKELVRAVEAIDERLAGADREMADRFPEMWLAARLLEGDADMTGRIADKTLIGRIAEIRERFEKEQNDAPEIRAAETRYGWIAGLCRETSKITPEARTDFSDRIDSVLLHRVLGLPIFLGLMYLMFQLVFTLAEKPMEWIEDGFGGLGAAVMELWPKAADSPLRDLLVDGVIGGVGGVLVFLPNIVLLFLAIAFLEGTGYMARAAFIMDRIMNRIGLHGKSFIPMLLGFGCTVPAIMGCRTLENRRDRLTTILVLPFMSCGARLPIYSLLIPAFFPGYLQAWMLWIIYVMGIVFAVAGAKLLRSTVFKGESVPFVMELPPYRMPTLRAVLTLMWDRAGEYCKKAGTIILGVSILLWAMTAYPKKPEFERDYDSEREIALRDYMDGVAGIGTRFGPDGSGAIARWASAGLAMCEAENEFWEREPGFAEAEQAHENALAAVYGGPGGGAIALFSGIVDELDAMDDAFGEDFGGAERENAINALDADETALAAAMAYRDDVRAAFDAANEEIDNAEAGEQLAYSISGRIGRFFEPVLLPIGFDWRIGTAIIGSFAAKEVFVAQMGIVYSVGEADEDSDSLRDKLAERYTPLQAFCMMVYALLSLPCVATIAVAKRETGGWKYAVFMMISLTAVAYVATFAVYQVGTLFGIGV